MRYDVPDNLQPMSPWKYFGLNILYAIPIIGFIFLVCHAIGSSNINKKNYARSFFCIVVIVAVIVGICLATGAISSVASAIAGGLSS